MILEKTTEGQTMRKIQMIGIDHSNASVEERELFSLTKTKKKELMEAVTR